MNPKPLPPEFYWRPHASSTAALCYGRRIIALVELGNGRVRSTRNVDTRNATYETHSNADIATRFINAWAAKWRDRIIAQYDCIGVGVPLSAPRSGEPLPELPFHVPARKVRKRR